MRLSFISVMSIGVKEEKPLTVIGQMSNTISKHFPPPLTWRYN